MRKQVYGRKFKRDKNERRALFNGLISSMIANESIKTTEEKAKAIRGELEKIVTRAKKADVTRKLLNGNLKPFEVDRMINDIAPRFKNRPGGYTRIIKLGKRFNDGALMVSMQWVDGPVVKEEKPKAEKAAVKKLPAKAVSKPVKAVKKTKEAPSKKVSKEKK